ATYVAGYLLTAHGRSFFHPNLHPHVLFALYLRYVDRHVLLPFPTRRSSDLWWCLRRCHGGAADPGFPDRVAARAFWGFTAPRARSEEHTSELQSREKLVCRLLLEKKTNINTLFDKKMANT